MNEGGSININISTGTIIKGILIIILCVGLFVLRDLVMVVLTAVVIASVIEPGTRMLVRRKFPRPLAVFSIYIVIFIILALIFYFLIPPILTELSQVISSIPKQINTVEMLSSFKHGTLLNLQGLFPNLPATISTGAVIGRFTSDFSTFSGGFVNTLTNFFGGVISFILIIVLSFYLAVQDEGVTDFLKIITPISQQKYVINLWERSEMKIGRWMQGQLLLGLIVAVLIYFGLILLNIKHALLLALLAGIFELIPVFGMSLSGIPTFILGFVDGGITLALLVAGLYLIVQQFEANLIYPLVVKKIVGVPPLLVIIALVAGAKLGGFLGALLSVPISVALMEVLEDVQKRKKLEIEMEVEE